MPERKPYLSAAFFCERVMEEKDGVLSAIRLVDTFTAHTNLPAGCRINACCELQIRQPDSG